ncbi:MAG TPA: TIGR03435 family protein [Bryobacteraceae bacterium]|nr:TIGR03435 family protein [Bryobacteraceae bacterium]
MGKLLATGGLSMLLAWGALGQVAPPSFEVVSVKPADEVRSVSITPRRSGNRISYITLAGMLVDYAYGVQPFQVSGGLPDGVYDIEARAAGTPSEDQIRLMLQTVLTDRFHLRLHRETKVMPVYDLVVAKGGSKLKAGQGGELMLDGRPAPAGVGMWATRTGPRLVSKGGSMGQLAEALARALKGPVMDRTGITGTFDFDVRYALDTLPSQPGSTADAAPLETAIREQLGLRLERAKARSRSW